MASKPELRVWWSKRERDFVIDYPSRPDGHLMHAFMSREFLDKTMEEHLRERGYDVTTLRISVRKKKSSE
jgi:hypothetical protein